MPRILVYLLFASLVLAWPATANAQSVVVPAGTLLHCTLDEPDFSSATVSPGDPFVCHMNSFERFGRAVFPRGSYLAGHLEAAKEPGHFIGKGYLKLAFDRVGLPDADFPVPSKVIAARGFRVDRKGDILGHGHAKRDAVEWLLPPLWPWKVLTLPARGPRPTLRGEEPITLRLMNDIEVPRAASASSDRPPYASQRPASNRSATLDPPSQLLARSANNPSSLRYSPPSVPALANESGIAYTLLQQSSGVDSNTLSERGPLTLFALKSDTIFAVASYRIDDGQIHYTRPSGLDGSVSVSDVDWRKTSHLNTELEASRRYKAH